MTDELRSISDLLELQRLDSDIDRLLERRQTLPELDAYRDAAEKAEKATAALSSLQEQLRDTELAADKADGELQIMEEKVRQTESRLFAGGMSARETENMRLDVEQLRRQQSELETAVLEGLEQRDQLRGEVEAARQEAEQLDDRKQDLDKAIKAAWSEIDTDLAAREASKTELVPGIDPELLELYERLRPLKEGVAIAELEAGVCGGCHLKMSAAELEEALAGDPPRCTHCRRIVVP